MTQLVAEEFTKTEKLTLSVPNESKCWNGPAKWNKVSGCPAPPNHAAPPFGHTQGSMAVQRPRSTALPSSNRLNHKGTQRCKWLSHHKLTGGGNITSRHSCTRNHTPKTLFLMWFLQPLQRLFPVCICLKTCCLVKQLKGPLFQYRT